MHPQLRKSYVPLSCPSLVVFWPRLSIDSQEKLCIRVHRCHYSCGPSSHSIPKWLGETNSSTSSISRIGSKQLYPADQMQSSFWSVLPWSVTIFMSRVSWELHHLLWILDAVILLAIIVPCWFRIIVTGMPTSVLWCAKSILLPTPLLGS